MSHSASPHPRPLGGRPLPAVPTIRRPSPSDCTSFTHHRPSTRSSFDYPLSSPQSGSPPPSHTPALSVSSPSPVPSVHARSARPVVKLSLPSKGQVYNNHTPSSTNSYDYQSDRSSFDDYPTPPPSLRSATNNNLKLQLPAISTNLSNLYLSNPTPLPLKPTLSSRPSVPSISLQIPNTGPRRKLSKLTLDVVARPGSYNRKGSDADGSTTSGSDMDDDEQDYGGYYGRLQPENNHFTDLRGDLNPTVLPGIPTVTPHNAHKYGRNVDDDNSDHNPRPRKTGADASSLDDVRVYVNSIEAEHQRTLASKGPNSSDSESISTTWHNWSEDSLEELGRLGEGAGGAVYKVRDIESGLIMAKKSIPGTIETTPKQLIRELEFLKGCVHENITTFYGAFVTKPESERGVEVCVLMEFGEGGSLDAISHQIQKKGLRVSEKVVGKVAIGILSGLDYLHSKKVVHRDIKPSNILLTRKGVVKLCDFGVSGDLVQSEAKTFLGTGYYMAPERITGQSYSIRAEVWSTGITLIEFAQNEFPYPPNLSHFELVDVIVRSPPPQLDEGEVDGRVWSELMRDFIRVCLTVEAADRPPPKEMLKHEWILKSEKEKLNMKELVRDIWGWEKSKKKRKEPKRMHSLDAGVASGEDEGKDGEF